MSKKIILTDTGYTFYGNRIFIEGYVAKCRQISWHSKMGPLFAGATMISEAIEDKNGMASFFCQILGPAIGPKIKFQLERLLGLVHDLPKGEVRDGIQTSLEDALIITQKAMEKGAEGVDGGVVQ